MAEVIVEQLCTSFVELYQSIENLEKDLVHSPGSMVHKGPKKQYFYWQYYQKGRQFQGYVKKEAVDAVYARIEKLKRQKERLMELKRVFRDTKKALRAYRISWQELLDEFKKKAAQKEEQKARQAEAQRVAKDKRYSENYKHATDKGDLVASKSEAMIANLLYSQSVKYEYERVHVLEGRKIKPDFTVWRPDGTMLLWEHAGLLDDPGYAQKFQAKLRLYERHGYTHSENLIITRDKNGAFDLNEARRQLEIYELV